MPTDDKQVLVVGQGPVPADATIPGLGQIKPKVVRAVYDGNNASGDFLPVLQVISDGGLLIAEYVGEKIAAGASASVSWFPHVAKAAAAAAVQANVFAHAFRDFADGGQVIVAGTQANASSPNATTTDATIMDWRTQSQTNDTLDLFGVGTYLCWGTAHWSVVNGTVSSIITSTLQNNYPHTPFQPLLHPNFDDGIGNAQSEDFTVIHRTGSSQSLIFQHSNADVGDHTVQQSYFTVLYVPTT